MTNEEREEALAIMNVIIHMIEKQYDNDRVEKAVDTAIAALKAEPCEDCVSREAFLDAFWKLDVELRPSAIDAITNIVNSLPSVTPKPRTGKWIRQGNDYTDYYECEHCGIAVGLDDIKNFCPNCGQGYVIETGQELKEGDGE